MHIYYSFAADSPAIKYTVGEYRLAQIRQGAKEKENELTEPVLCVFAPLREILLCLVRLCCDLDIVSVSGTLLTR